MLSPPRIRAQEKLDSPIPRKMCPQCAHNKNGPDASEPFTLYFIGRDDWIRTSDPLTPSQVRYQAALHPEHPRAASFSLQVSSPEGTTQQERYLTAFSAGRCLGGGRGRFCGFCGGLPRDSDGRRGQLELGARLLRKHRRQLTQ